jgi:adenylosuccinate synthase
MTNTVYLTVDLGFGDAGKGSVVDFLTRETNAHTVVRYNGGAQAGHRVLTAEAQPREHVFSQFGSGTLAGAATHLSAYMLLDPLAMQVEAAHLQQLGCGDVFERTTIAERALVITPFQRAANRLLELQRGANRHGSCGLGIGETTADSLRYGERALRAIDLRNPQVLRGKLEFLRAVNLAKVQRVALYNADAAALTEWQVLTDPHWLADTSQAYAEFGSRVQLVGPNFLANCLQQPGAVVFEGAQGVLLDEWYGFHPHTTWATTTLTNADSLLQAAGYHGATERIGITRAYGTRHGAGPLVSESAVLGEQLPDACNGQHAWQQHFRVGWLDLVLLHYACQVVGRLDYVALTCFDRWAALSEWQVVEQHYWAGQHHRTLAKAPQPDLAYQAQLTAQLLNSHALLRALPNPDALLPLLKQTLGLPVGLLSTGASAAEKRWLR